ncbi:hypothetical protein [Nocardia sp. NPDC049707]|uniref:hypothetical protein n=1 Tax=Nocardia sp. NPDC049707 TaxID=3154735 RepID=UPI00343C0DD7
MSDADEDWHAFECLRGFVAGYLCEYGKHAVGACRFGESQTEKPGDSRMSERGIDIAGERGFCVRRQVPHHPATETSRQSRSGAESIDRVG